MAEKEYIERETLLDRIRGTGYAEPIKSNLLVMAVTIPAADVRPVMRCKDCMLRQYCKVAQYLGEDGFCSNGEKKEES